MVKKPWCLFSVPITPVAFGVDTRLQILKTSQVTVATTGVYIGNISQLHSHIRLTYIQQEECNAAAPAAEQ